MSDGDEICFLAFEEKFWARDGRLGAGTRVVDMFRGQKGLREYVVSNQRNKTQWQFHYSISRGLVGESHVGPRRVSS